MSETTLDRFVSKLKRDDLTKELARLRAVDEAWRAVLGRYEDWNPSGLVDDEGKELITLEVEYQIARLDQMKGDGSQ